MVPNLAFYQGRCSFFDDYKIYKNWHCLLKYFEMPDPHLLHELHGGCSFRIILQEILSNIYIYLMCVQGPVNVIYFGVVEQLSFNRRLVKCVLFWWYFPSKWPFSSWLILSWGWSDHHVSESWKDWNLIKMILFSHTLSDTFRFLACKTATGFTF